MTKVIAQPVWMEMPIDKRYVRESVKKVVKAKWTKKGKRK